MPLIVRMEFEDGSEEVVNIPAEIWRYNNDDITKVFITEKPVVNFELDPYLQTADTELSNNYFPRRLAPSRFDIYKQQQREQQNPMQRERSTSRKNSKNNSGQ